MKINICYAGDSSSGMLCNACSRSQAPPCGWFHFKS